MKNLFIIALSFIALSSQASAYDLNNSTDTIIINYSPWDQKYLWNWETSEYWLNGSYVIVASESVYTNTFVNFYNLLASNTAISNLTIDNSVWKWYSSSNDSYYCWYRQEVEGIPGWAWSLWINWPIEKQGVCENTYVSSVNWGTNLILQNYWALDGGWQPNWTIQPEPFQPVQENISGLSCDTYSMPDMSSVSWYSDFGSLANRDVYREDESLIQTGTGASSQNLDVMAIVGASSGATLPLGSLSFTGTTYADIADIWASGKQPAIYSWLKRDGSIAWWNVINIRWVNTSGFFGKYGIFEGKSTDGITSQKIMYSSGWVAEANLYNNRIGTTWQVFWPVSGFSGVRVGYAPYTQRKSCKLAGINSCEWKIEGGANVCGPVISQNFEVWVCAIAGSGSLYGSGSCVPVVDSTGKVVDPGILPWEGAIITLPDGTTKTVRIQSESTTIVFACPESKDEPWYKYIFSCAGEVVENIFNKATGTTSAIINSQVGTFSNERLYTGSFTGIIQNFWNGTNPLVGTGATINTGALFIALKNKLDTVGQPWPEIWQKMFTGGIAVGLLLMILSILGIILSAIRDRSDISSKK